MTPTAEVRAARASGVHGAVRELAELHRAMLAQGGDERSVRLAVLTLVAACADEAGAVTAAEVVAGIAAEHPARALIVVADPSLPGGVSAELSLRCSTTGPQVCAEVVQLRAGGEAALHLASVVTPLLLPDVPVHLWLVGAPDPGQALQPDALALVQRVVVDSDAYADPRGFLATLDAAAARRGGGLPVTDLAWARLGPWRELCARSFDAPERRRLLAELQGAELVVAGGAPDGGALLLAAWLRTRLAGAGLAAPAVAFVPARLGAAAGGPVELRLAAEDAGEAFAVVIAADGERLRARLSRGGAEVLAMSVAAPPPSLADLVGAALQEGGLDRVHGAALHGVAELS